MSSPTTSSEEKYSDKDISDLIGNLGKWQIIYIIVSLYVFAMSAWWTFFYQFIAPDLKFTCSLEKYFDNKIPLEVLVTSDNCKVIWDNKTEKCNVWDYDHSFYKETLTEKWNLVCDKYWMIAFFSSVATIGDLVATLFTGYLADRYGRRPIIIGSTIPAIGASVLAIFAPSEIWFAVACFFFGMSGVTLYCVTFVYIMEIVGSKYRGELGMAVACGWTLGYITIPLIVWLLRDAFWMLATTALAGALLLPLACFISESPRWLILKGRLDEAENLLRNIMKRNGSSTEDLRERLEVLSENIYDCELRTYNITDLFRGSRLRKDVLIIYFYWFVNSFVYYGISLNASIFGSNALLNFSLFGLVEIPSNIFTSWLIHHSGRKGPLVGLMFFAAICCFCFIVIPEDLTWLKIVFVVAGKFFVNASFSLIYPYSSERIPTVCRSIGISGGNISGRIGGILAPNVRLLSRSYGVDIAMAIFGTLGLIASGISFLLPETKDKVLPETLEQGEEFEKNKPRV